MDAGHRCPLPRLGAAARGDAKAWVHSARRALTEHDRLAMPFERARTQLLFGQLTLARVYRKLDITSRTELRQHVLYTAKR